MIVRDRDDLWTAKARYVNRDNLPAGVDAADRTLPRLLRVHADRNGAKPLLHIGATTLDRGQALDLAARTAGALTQAGIGRGDRVAVMCSNRLEFVALLLGCGWLGAVIVPVNTASRGPQLRHVLENSGARLLAVEAHLCETLAAIDLSSLPVEAIWTIGDGAQAMPGPAVPMPEGGEPAEPAAIRPGDTLAILYTSGTTGPAKGVCCPHAQFFWWGVNTGTLLGLREGDVLCTTLPLFHTNALNTLFQALLHGASVSYEPRFSASGFWATVAERKATVTYLLGAMVPILLSRPPSEAERAHEVRIALAPGVPQQVKAAFKERTGIGLLEGYGSTETNFVIGTGIERQKPGCMGPVFPGFSAKVVDADDNELPDGEAGELTLRADEPFAFATGYFGMPEKTVEAWRNLWFHSGDRVVREPDGYFRFVDRLKDAIRRRGENISSFEVEQVLLGHPAIATAAVYPVPSTLGEDEVMAAIVLKPGSELSAPELMAHCEPRLAYFAVPRFVDFLDALPATENGKVQKFKLRERGVTATTWDREAAGYVLKRL
jgi:crotonobetaine/carnitine-CoA ligase